MECFDVLRTGRPEHIFVQVALTKSRVKVDHLDEASSIRVLSYLSRPPSDRLRRFSVDILPPTKSVDDRAANERICQSAKLFASTPQCKDGAHIVFSAA
jgi:hypothetical protein